MVDQSPLAARGACTAPSAWCMGGGGGAGEPLTSSRIASLRYVASSSHRNMPRRCCCRSCSRCPRALTWKVLLVLALSGLPASGSWSLAPLAWLTLAARLLSCSRTIAACNRCPPMQPGPTDCWSGAPLTTQAATANVHAARHCLLLAIACGSPTPAGLEGRSGSHNCTAFPGISTDQSRRQLAGADAGERKEPGHRAATTRAGSQQHAGLTMQYCSREQAINVFAASWRLQHRRAPNCRCAGAAPPPSSQQGSRLPPLQALGCTPKCVVPQAWIGTLCNAS